jgi:outer membrane lipoprotein-sorting protein
MKKLFRVGLTALALAFMLGSFAATETKAQGVNEILKRMDDHYKALSSLRTSVTYEKYDSVLRESEKMEGRAIYLPQKGKDALFRVDWTKPEESLAVINKKYVIYRPKLQTAYVGSTDKAIKKDSSGISSPFAFINMSRAQLKANYSFRYLGEETLSNGTKTWHLELTPKTAQKYKMAEIWVDGDGMPIKMKVIENNNDTSQVLLSNLEKNIALKKDGSDFQINPPAGTKIIKN